MPEAQIRSALVSIEPASGIVGTTMESVISIVVTGTGTVVHYDQWEDGYEVDLNNPTQSSTQIWGDGNDANGKPPGYANDPASFTSGAVINLRNQIPLPRNPANLLYDGRDRLGGTKALVVTRTGWAVTPGTVLAGSVEVTATLDYGTQYISPVGQDVSASSMFEYVGLYVQARDDGTTVAIDADGAGSGAATNVTLNRGESYLVNGGVLKGATVSANKPVQTQLITGDIGARYETDWMTLYPVDQWSSIYYSPVGTAADDDATFAFLYNNAASAITINTTTNVGTTSFSIPAKGVYAYQIPKNSGAKFESVGSVPFFGIVLVGANPAANNVHDWGFTLVPGDSLTTEAVCGWGPGSSDLSQNGSPVWVTPTAATRIYVDYNGDRAGSLTDPKGNKYDAHYDMSALEIRTLLDPDKDQSAMRLYTLDGTLITAAWGQDPAIAGPGNPFLDVGTTVLPFPVPQLKKSSRLVTDSSPAGPSVGDVLEYTVQVDNRGLLPLGNLLVLDPLTPQLSYVANSTSRDGDAIPDSTSGSLFPLDTPGYTIPIIRRGGSTTFVYRATIVAAGSIKNSVSNTSYNLVSENDVEVPPSGGSTAGVIEFTDSADVSQATYLAGTDIWIKLTDADANNEPAVAETLQVVVRDTTSGDLQTITLTETGPNTGIFRNTTALPSSTTSGTTTQDGTLYVAAGDNLFVNYTDPEFGDTVSDTATVIAPAMTKQLYLSTDGSGSPDQDMDRISPVAANDLTTATSQTITTGTATIAVDSTSTSSAANPFSSITFSHTTGTGSDRLLLVGISYEDDNTAGLSVTGVTYAGQALTFVGRQISSQEAASEIWRLVNPPSGTANVIVSATGSSTGDSMFVGATTFTGVSQSTPLGTFASATNNSGTASVAVTSASGELVFDVLGLDDGRNATAAGAQTTLWNGRTESGSDGIRSAASTKAGASSVTMSWTVDTDAWALSAVPIKPATTIGTTTFTQTPSFFQNFTLPAGGPLSVVNYVNVLSGSMPANPSITALLKYGSTTIATLTGPVYNSGAGTLTWTGATGSAVTVPSGQAIDLVITSNQSGVSFTIQYDSTTKPSVVALPTTTVIDVNSLAVYDAPYPGGSLVTSTANGATLYVRSVVSDPFGAYDITSLGLSIDGSGTADDISTTLTAPNVVATSGALKTYEYVWTTGATTGAYNIAVTANEGTEGITDTAATSVVLTFLDTGTPSITEFTSSLNGPGTETYAGNATVYVRTTDLDQNTSATTIETITVVVTSSSGDSETITLTETGPNTGVFVGTLTANTTTGTSTNDGTLKAPLGSVLHVNYVDPTDPTDTSSDVATVPNIAPAISVDKTLISPADGIATVGETVQFSLQVTNTGNTTLSTVAFADNYPSANLSYASASRAPTSTPPGSVYWANVGPLTPGQSVTILVNFTALSSAAPATNLAIADAGGGVNDNDTAEITITHPGVVITKTLLSPNPGPANIGDNVVFRITAQNMGDTAIASLPIEDTFSGASFSYVSATIAPDAVGSGSLLWLDVTGAGNLAVGNTLTMDVTLKAKGAAAPASNVASADYTTDVNGDPAPPSSSTASLTLIAATITGHVYDDPDQTGTLTIGDTGLFGIVVQLFTDPNGDGNPADGVLVGYTTTDSAGYYEFGNLGLGNYVVVESDPAAYSSSGDTGGANDNRTPVVVTTLTTYAGNDFFDYLPDPADYADISGKVWNDTDHNAVGNGAEVGLANIAIDLVQDTNGNGIADLGEPIYGSTLTAADGTYAFSQVPPGNYVIRESDLFGYTSTGDAQGVNNNQIALVAAAGQSYTARDFFDVQTGTISGHLFVDTDGNGVQGVGEPNLPHVDVLITDSLGRTQTVSTDSSGNWTATVPPGDTVADVQETDPDFTSVIPPGNYLQTAGTDPTTVEAFANTNTFAGNDGYFIPGTVTGHLYLDINGNHTQDSGEPNLTNVNVIVTDSTGHVQTVATNASGNWSALVPGGSTEADVDETDPDYTAHVPPGSPQTEGADPTTVTAVVNTTVSAGNDAWTLLGTHSISGQVRDDFDNDGAFTDADTSVPGVTIKLWLDFNGDGLLDSGDSLIATTTTDSFGNYSFTGLPDGMYLVQEINPAGASSTADKGGANDDLIPVTIAGANEVAEDFLDAVDPAGYAYDVVTKQIIPGGSISVSGPGAVTILRDGSTGQYSFVTDGTAGSYTITYSPPLGYIFDPTRPVAGASFDPTGGPSPTMLGSGEDPSNPGYLTNASAAANPYYFTFDLAPGDPFVLNNNFPLRLQTPRRYTYWKVITPGGGPSPGSNGDGDCYSDVIEYALNLNPNSGVQTTPAFRGKHNTTTGKVDAMFNRVAGSVTDVTYTLQGLTTLTGSPAGWAALAITPVVTSNGDGTETVTFPDLESDPLFTGLTSGLVRLKLDLDEDLNTVTDATANTPVFGWTRRLFNAECVMTGYPYLKDKNFCGAVDSVTGSVLNVASSAGASSIVAQFTTGRQYFIEVYSGDNAGHRFEIDEAASTASTIALHATNGLNTQTSIPANLAGDKVVIREHHTLNDLFPSTQFTSTNDPTTADRLLFYNRSTSSYDTYWLATNGGSPMWLLIGDATLTDMGGRIIDPCEGWFTHPKGGAQTVVWNGMVRANPLACPLLVGSNFIGTGYPMDQSPAMRDITTGAGFSGNRNPLLADQLLFWKGYTSTQALAYYNHFLLSTGALQQWTEIGNATLTNENNLLLFKHTAGSIYKMRAPLPSYVMPLPWTP